MSRKSQVWKTRAFVRGRVVSNSSAREATCLRAAPVLVLGKSATPPSKSILSHSRDRASPLRQLVRSKNRSAAL